jgi:hypothetical protein
MKLVVLTVCVNYTDMLEISYYKNKNEIENWFIITSNSDIETQNFCIKNNINFFTTDAFYKKNSVFNKAAALNSFFNNVDISEFEWILLLDADILLNNSISNFSKKLDENKLEDIIYNKDVLNNTSLSSIFFSCPRLIFDTPEQYKSNKGFLEPIYFIGYFQLFKKDRIINHLKYQIFVEFPTAANYDDTFRNMYWPDRKYAAISNIVYHLGPSAKNWSGRVTDRWNLLELKDNI